MRGYKEPGFQDRMNAAEQARSKAIARLKAAPAVDPVVVKQRAAKAIEREAALADKRAQAKVESEAKRAAKVRNEAVSVAATTEPEAAGPTEEERKAARDARYAARKARRK